MSSGRNVDPANLKQYIVPAVGAAAIIVLIGLVVAFSGASERKMSDGSDGTAADPDLKEITPGVKYRDLKEGAGDPCPVGAKVTMHYTGWLTDGTVFDSSKEGKLNPTPANFDLNNLIAGWKEGIPGMKPGGIRKLVIAPDKGYGSQSNGKIPGGSTLIFEVQLIDFALPKNVASGPGMPMPYDNSNGGTDDPGLKDVGGGLKIRDLKEGTGEAVKPGASVSVHYVGWLVDGTVFDSSRKGGKPVSFSLNEVVKGWGQGIPGMKPGGVRKLVIPAALGYGARGQGDIPPNATLVFEVELVN